MIKFQIVVFEENFSIMIKFEIVVWKRFQNLSFGKRVKAFSDERPIVTKMMIYVLDRVENIVER